MIRRRQGNVFIDIALGRERQGDGRLFDIKHVSARRKFADDLAGIGFGDLGIFGGIDEFEGQILGQCLLQFDVDLARGLVEHVFGQLKGAVGMAIEFENEEGPVREFALLETPLTGGFTKRGRTAQHFGALRGSVELKRELDVRLFGDGGHSLNGLVIALFNHQPDDDKNRKNGEKHGNDDDGKFVPALGRGIAAKIIDAGIERTRGLFGRHGHGGEF